MKCFLLGEHLGHSYSKDIHEKIGRYGYNLMEVPKDELDAFMQKRDFDAINVTIPYKQSVIPYLHYISEDAKAIGAVNTIVNKAGKLYGYNTDFYGMRALIIKEKIEISGKKVLILGTGGTSNTAYAVVKDLCAREIYKVSRKNTDNCITYEEAVSLHNDADVIINTTPCGMWPNTDSAAIDISCFKNLTGVVDVVYNPLRTKLVIEAQSRGIKATGGLYMLVMQAAKACEIFTESAVDDNISSKIYRELLEQKQNIVLVGMPGSGKTTVGKILAEKKKVSLIDTDDEIIKKEKTDIRLIFESKGEEYFRDVESNVIKEVSDMSGMVISTGGGAVLKNLNVENLKKNGIIYFLDRDIATIKPTDDRPLSDSDNKLKSLYEKRYPIYTGCADHIIRVEKTPKDVAERILNIYDEN